MQSFSSKCTVSFFIFVVITHTAFAAVNEFGRVTPPAQVNQRFDDKCFQDIEREIQATVLHAKRAIEKKRYQDVVVFQETLKKFESFQSNLNSLLFQFNQARAISDVKKALVFHLQIFHMLKDIRASFIR